MDFVKANLSADSSDEDDGSPRNSQPTSEGSAEFTPSTHGIKVKLNLGIKMSVMKILFFSSSFSSIYLPVIIS